MDSSRNEAEVRYRANKRRMDQGTNMAATPPDVNNGARSKDDVYPCTRCQKHCKSGIKCNRCSMWTHNICSELPTYYIVVLTNTNRRYTCLPCTKQNYPDFNSQAEEIDEIKHNEETHKSSSNSQSFTGLDITQSTEPEEQTEVEGSTSTSREVFGSYNSPEDMPLTLPVSQTQNSSNSNSTQLDRGTARAQETQHQNQRPNNKRTPKKSVCRHYKQRKCKYGKMGIGCPFDHPRACLKLLKYGMDKERGCRQGKALQGLPSRDVQQLSTRVSA